MRTCRNSILCVAAMALALWLTACSPKAYPLRPDSRAPASVGQLAASPSKNGNLALGVKVDHLPEAGMLSKELTTFVVWLKPAGSEQWLNIGQMQLNKDRHGELETLTAFPAGEVKVTAEAKSTTLQPSEWTVLEGSFKKD